MALDAQLYSDADVFVVIDAVAELGDRWSFPAAADQAQKRLQSASIGIIDYQNAVDIIREAAAASSNNKPTVSSSSTSRPRGGSFELDEDFAGGGGGGGAGTTTMGTTATTTTSSTGPLLRSAKSEVSVERVIRKAIQINPDTGRNPIHDAIVAFDLGE